MPSGLPAFRPNSIHPTGADTMKGVLTIFVAVLVLAVVFDRYKEYRTRKEVRQEFSTYEQAIGRSTAHLTHVQENLRSHIAPGSHAFVENCKFEPSVCRNPVGDLESLERAIANVPNPRLPRFREVVRQLLRAHIHFLNHVNETEERFKRDPQKAFDRAQKEDEIVGTEMTAALKALCSYMQQPEKLLTKIGNVTPTDKQMAVCVKL
jgi:hypothetical protein